MKSKDKLKLFLSIALLLFIGIIVFIVMKNRDNTFSLDEKQWIEENKNQVIDISILNDIPVLSYNGEGVIFSLLDDLEKKAGLKFNKTPYKLTEEVNAKYVFKLVKERSKNDLLVLHDNFTLISKNDYVYTDIENIKNLNIGILSSEKDTITNLLDSSNTFVEFGSVAEVLDSVDNVEKNIDGIIILKSLGMEKIVRNHLTIQFEFYNYSMDYVISLNGDDTLNSIFRKYFNKWQPDNYESYYNEYLLKHYYDFASVKDSDRTDVKAKKYVYGFVENGILDSIKGSKLKGIGNLVLKNFSNFSGISITFKKYNTFNELVNAFNKNEVDIFLNESISESFDSNYLITRSGLNNRLVVISKNTYPDVIDTYYALNGKKIALVESSIIEKYLGDVQVEIHKYKNFNDLLKHVSDNEVIIMEMDNYLYYKNSNLSDYRLNFIFGSDIDYKYVVNNNEAILANLFDFYINYVQTKFLINSNYSTIAYQTVNYLYILIVVVISLLIALVLISINKIKHYLVERKKKKRINLSKTDKLKYIDQLTSLKNRAYLNSKIDSWDNSEIYPQSIVIIDLNNISAINDNYGREEGDRVIIEAANILINSQLPNSEIIRTDGNEFLIYLVGYSEKNVISYLRNLSREMKKLSHGFGAATGYSMISDGIKTIDDAVNEATIEMKNNKEDIDY
ncbi:MAG: GGDEF domain-containing protein [Bacilli bacterium]|nr:GGDEF domain-containing protein [Bacilli bacterium]